MINTHAQILQNYTEGRSYLLMELEADEIAREAVPGQFVHLRVTGANDPLLRRPISIMLTNPRAGTIRLLVKTVGRGTELLADMRPGARLDLLGPLGNGFQLPKPGKDALLVAGGIGVAPLVFLADALRLDPALPAVRGLYGGASDEDLPAWTEFAGRCDEFYVSTEDGSAGQRGRVTDAVPEQLARGDVQVVYTCGPRAMMANVARMAKEAGLPCYASLEQWMGCGVGACLGCVIPVHGEPGFTRVCTEGPVFAAEEIAWEKMDL